MATRCVAATRIPHDRGPPGPAIIGPAEAPWLVAWHFSNHGTAAFDGGVLVVTPHGWTDFMSCLGGYEPRLELTAA